MMRAFFSFLTIFIFASFFAFGQHSFDPSAFKNPDLEFGPFTRWWWPGNDVDKKELQREVKLFAQNGFAGVEIQPLTVGINPSSKRQDKIYSWDTKSFYDNLSAVMKTALKTGLTIDLNGASGWPIGGPFLKPEESILSMESADTTLIGGRAIDISIPKITTDNAHLTRNGIKIYNAVNLNLAKLISLTAARILKEEKGKTFLDSGSFVSLKPHVYADRIKWVIPGTGRWKIIAMYAIPNGEKPLYTATKRTSWVTDHFNIAAVKKTYEYLFDGNTGLSTYYGKPFRAVFSDSKEFIINRHISEGFNYEFKKRRGYDVDAVLVANAIPGYNNAYSFGRDTVPNYSLSSEDWRRRYDYNQTLTELYKENFLKTSMDWLQSRNLQYRGQEYGLRTDVIGTSGMVSIPETEQLSGSGSDGFTKLVSSGAHLYNRSVVAQESFVFNKSAGMTTPQKIKAFSNKSFAAGINQIIYHGSPYKYQTEEYGTEGWTAWATPFRPFNYSSNINEAYNYWKYIKEVNTFISRSQYALRSGKPKTDVLIYFPFIDFESSQMVVNPEETFISGFFKGLETVAPNVKKIGAKPTAIQQWFINIWPLINKIESQGLTWDYINDESLLIAENRNNQISVRENLYTSLIIANIPYMPVNTASKLKELSKLGSNVLVYGTIPTKQPGFLNHKEMDLKVETSFKDILQGKGVKRYTQLADVERWAQSIEGGLQFDKPYSFLKLQKRQMADGGMLYFLWNKTTEPVEVGLTVPKQNAETYFLVPEDGKIIKNEGSNFSTKLHPYSSVFLYCPVAKSIPEKLLEKNLVKSEEEDITEIPSWNLEAGKQRLKNISLFDWREHDDFKYLLEPGIYTSSFTINLEKDKRYHVDLGTVYYTAEIFINGQKAGTSLWPPYRAEITSLLKSNENTIKVIVTPSDRNYFVGEGVKGNPKYTQYKSSGNTLLPTGMLGPVKIVVDTVK